MSTTNILDLNNRINELAESYSANKVMMSDGVTSVEDAVDALKARNNIKYFDVTVPSGSSNYNYSSKRPADFYQAVSAVSIGGSIANITQLSNTVVFFNPAITGSSTVIRIVYIAQ